MWLWKRLQREKRLFRNQLRVSTPLFVTAFQRNGLRWTDLAAFERVSSSSFLFFFVTFCQADSSVKVHWDMTQIQTLWNSLPQLASLVQKKRKKRKKLLALFSSLDLCFHIPASAPARRSLSAKVAAATSGSSGANLDSRGAAASLAVTITASTPQGTKWGGRGRRRG